MISIAPTILVSDEGALKGRLAAIKPYYMRAQVDVLNNSFVNATSFADPDVIERHGSELQCEIELMVDINGYDIAQWNRAWVDAISFHVEASSDPAATIDAIRSFQKRVVLSINPDTDIEMLEPFIRKIDGVLFMTVYPGRSGNPFQTHVLDAIRTFHVAHPGVPIEVDGGISAETMPEFLDIGVTGFAIGSYLSNEKIEENTQVLISLVEAFEQKQASRKRS